MCQGRRRQPRQHREQVEEHGRQDASEHAASQRFTEGLALLALNGALYAADRSDRIAALRVRLRDNHATQTIWSYAAIKSIAVALNPIPVADLLGGTAVDVTMVITLSRIYGLDISWRHARELVTSILKAAGWLAGTGNTRRGSCSHSSS